MWKQKWLCQHSLLSVTNNHMRNFWGPLLSRWSWPGGGTFMLQHMISSGRNSACLIVVLWLCQAKLRPDTAAFQHLGAPGGLAVLGHAQFPRESRASTSPGLWAGENGTFWNELLPVSHRWWGNEATLPSCWVFEVSQVAHFCYTVSRLLTQMKSSKYFWVQSYSWSYC